MFSYLGRSCTPTISKKIKSESEKSEEKKRIISKMWGRMSLWVHQKLKKTPEIAFSDRVELAVQRAAPNVFYKKKLEHCVWDQ